LLKLVVSVETLNPSSDKFRLAILDFRFYSRRKKSEGSRKKEEPVIAMVSAIKKVLTLLAVAID